MDPDRNWGKMETNRPDALPSEDAQMVKGGVLEKCPLPNCMFNDQDLIPALEYAKDIDRKNLLNLLNYTHFVEGTVLVHLRHQSDGHSILLRAYPRPCLGSQFSGYWAHGSLPGLELDCYRFRHLIIEDGKSMIVVVAEQYAMGRDAFTIELPEKSLVVVRRKAKRHTCREVMAELVQNRLEACGELLDFNTFGFRIKISPESSYAFDLFDPGTLVTVRLKRAEQVFFTGMCRCIRKQGDHPDKEVVLGSEADQINRFNKKKIRNPRQQLVSSSTVSFDHPLLRRMVHLEVHDVSTSGFSVYEKADEEVLFPGMIVPDLMINLAGALKMKCVAQVIYRLLEEEKGIRCGFAILDMDIETYSRLTHILSNALDPHSFVSHDVDMDALWRFFFDSGFIYPEKYHLIQANREDFKETYRRLYLENPEIARHFTYQKDGVIYGHISMVRAYHRAWLIHHHATRAMDRRRTGFMVLKQIMHYLNDMYRLPFAKMDFVLSYFRPENKFPNRVFGGFAETLKDARGCSMDSFSYMPFTSPSRRCCLDAGWSLQDCTDAGVLELRRWYNEKSGGLLLDALGLGRDDPGDESLEDVYARLGFVRTLRVAALIHDGALKAALILNKSEKGFNLSGLLHCIKVLVTDSDGLPWDVLSCALCQLADAHKMEGCPVLIYPLEYVERNDLPYQKLYHLWILNVQYGNAFLEYMQQRYKTNFGGDRSRPTFE
jgi:hypothetical protein